MEKNKEMIKALDKLKDAFEKVDKEWDKCDEMQENPSIWKMPFGKSFNEIKFAMDDWVEETKEELEGK